MMPVLAGVLLALAHPPAAFLLPALVGLVPLLVYIAELPAGPAGRWAATRAGLVTGAVWIGIQRYWIVPALLPHSPLAIPAYLLTVAVIAALVGAVAWAVHLTRDRIGLPLALGAALFWTAMEWAQAHAGDLAVPWLGLGTALAPFPRLAGAADLVGASGLGFWLAAVNGLVAMAIVRWRAGRPPREAAVFAAAAALALALPAAYGLWRAATLETRPVATVAVLGTAIPPEVKLDPARGVDSSLAAVRSLTARAAATGAAVVVWPEVAVPAAVEREPAVMAAVREAAREAGAPVLVGAYGVARQGAGAGAGAALTNTAFLLGDDGAGGPAAGARYDKRRLVPFVERVPLLAPGRLGRYGGLAPGDEATLFTLDSGARFGVLICSESIHAGLARGYRRDGADFLVSMTNDAWFGRTTGLHQHPAHLVMRAIETRTGIARSANAGLTMLIDPVGRTTAAPVGDTVLAGAVLTTGPLTLFVRWGDWLAAAAAIAALAALVAAGFPAVRSVTILTGSTTNEPTERP